MSKEDRTAAPDERETSLRRRGNSDTGRSSQHQCPPPPDEATRPEIVTREVRLRVARMTVGLG